MVCSELEVGIGQNDCVVLGTSEGLNPLAGGRCSFVDRARDRRRPYERSRCYVWRIEQRINGLLVAVHDVEDAVRQARPLPQLGDEHRGGGVALAWLEDEGVAAGDRY